MDGFPQRTRRCVLAATCAFAAVLSGQSAQAADLSIALILGVNGQSVEKQLLADTAPIMSGDSAKTDRCEYKSDCSLSY